LDNNIKSAFPAFNKFKEAMDNNIKSAFPAFNKFKEAMDNNIKSAFHKFKEAKIEIFFLIIVKFVQQFSTS